MNEAALEKVAKEVGRLDLSDHILAWDKKQGGFPPRPEQRICGMNGQHGRLQMRRDGAALMCCWAKSGVGCEYSEPVSR